jgi:uncharacterized SAM-binding protein YcdF (DUF218 family)
MLAIGVAGLFLISWPPAEWLLSRPLEGAYPVRPFRPAVKPAALVVLGSASAPPDRGRPYPLANTDTFEHSMLAAWIYTEIGPMPVLACEGGHAPHASVMRELLRGAGVADDFIWTEEMSLNTHQNAVFGAKILRQHGIRQIALVTDAHSMRRAAACFRKEGLEVIPAPCQFGQIELSADDLLPNWKAIRRSERNFHELLALGWYSLRGWI